MLENNGNNKNSEINLNLKVPPEQSYDSFSMKDLVLTLYNARKIFLTWCCIGLLLGIAAAGGYYITQKGGAAPVSTAGEVSITLTLNYPGAEYAVFPNGAEFDIKSFYDIGLWENVLATIGRDDIAPADAMGEVKIKRYSIPIGENGLPIESSLQEQILVNVLFELTIPSGSTIFADNSAKEEFLQAFCEEYKNSINNKYFIEDNIGILYGQQMRSWKESCKEIEWDKFNFERNFEELILRYSTLANWLEILYDANPSYKTSDGMNFNDFAREFKDICDDDISQWMMKIKDKIYIRNIDRFKEEFQYQINSMKMNREYSLEMVASYNDLLDSFQQKDTAQGVIVTEAVNILTDAKDQSEIAADLQKQIKQMEYYIEIMETDDPVLRENSREAEAALTAFIEGLDKNQEKLSGLIYEYYKQMNESNAVNSIIYTMPVTLQLSAIAASVSTTRLLMLFVGLTFVGFAIGFCAAFVKKYLPEKEKTA